MSEDVKRVNEKELQNPAQSQEYADFIVNYKYDIKGLVEFAEEEKFVRINENFGVLYVPISKTSKTEVTAQSYNAIPKCFGYMDLGALESSRITKLQNHPFLGLRGKGTLVAVIDSGIDYQNVLFRRGDTSRILRIWDQTIPGDETMQRMDEFAIPYGREYRNQEIDEALSSENPLEVVPTQDRNGHGTMLAAIAAGNKNLEEGFSGAAPEAGLIIVKLKPAKEYLREFYLLPKEAEAFQENDIMLGVAYAIERARELKRPLSICIGLGCSQGAHVGCGFLEMYLSGLIRFSPNFIAVAGGNEGNSRHHFYSAMTEPREVMELRVGPKESGFVLECWGTSFQQYQFQIQSPTGELLNVNTERGSGTQQLSFVFVETRIEASYLSMESQSGRVLLFLRFLTPAEGIWKINVKGKVGEGFHAWLPIQNFLSLNTYFLSPSPYETITNPGNSIDVLTMTAYNNKKESIYLDASRGFMVNGIVKPELAAPGVEIKVPGKGEKYGTQSGSSFAAAQTAGAAALLFEWAIVRENQPSFNGILVKNYLLRGATRVEKEEYPNREWGFGKLNLYQTFENID